MKKIAISLITHNDIKYSKPCLISLLNSDITKYDIKLFWWDNDSTDDISKFIDELGIDTYSHISKKNEGIVIPRIKLYEQIISEGYDYLLEIHSDMLFPSKWIDYIFDIDEELAIILMPTIVSTDSIMDVNKINELSNKYRVDDVIQCARQVHPWVIKLNMLQHINGYYDPIYSPMRLEDDDLVWRVLSNGYKIKATKNSIVCHYGMVTRNKTKLPASPNSIFENKNKVTLVDLIKLFDEHPVISI